MSKKQLPKRNVSFKLEKHPTAESLDRLRAQGIETLDDLDRFSDDSISVNSKLNASPMLDPSTVATDRVKSSPIDDALNIVINDSPSVAIDMSPSVVIDDKLNIAIDDSPSVAINNESNVVIESTIKDKKELDEKEVVFKINSLELLTASNKMSYTDIDHTDSSTVNPTSTDILATISSSTYYRTDSTTDIHTAIAPVKLGFTNPIDLFNYVQQTHSSSAQLIYKLIYKLSNERSKQTLRIGTKELLEKTKIKSHVTVRKAIDELIIKCSLELIEANQGKIPPVYKIIDLDEVLSKREEKGLFIDEDTKFLFESGKRLWPSTNDKIIADATDLRMTNTTDVHTVGTTSSTMASHPLSHPLSHTSNSIPVSKNNSSQVVNVRINELKGICEALGVKIINSPKLTELENYSLSHIIIGICKKVEESAKNSLTLLDCLEEIRDHNKSMNALPESILAKVAYDYFLKVKDR